MLIEVWVSRLPFSSPWAPRKVPKPPGLLWRRDLSLPHTGDKKALLLLLPLGGLSARAPAGGTRSYEVMIRSRGYCCICQLWYNYSDSRAGDIQTSFHSLLPLWCAGVFHTKGLCQKSKTLKGMPGSKGYNLRGGKGRKKEREKSLRLYFLLLQFGNCV